MNTFSKSFGTGFKQGFRNGATAIIFIVAIWYGLKFIEKKQREKYSDTMPQPDKWFVLDRDFMYFVVLFIGMTLFGDIMHGYGKDEGREEVYDEYGIV